MRVTKKKPKYNLNEENGSDCRSKIILKLDSLRRSSENALHFKQMYKQHIAKYLHTSISLTTKSKL